VEGTVGSLQQDSGFEQTIPFFAKYIFDEVILIDVLKPPGCSKCYQFATAHQLDEAM
jgi:hypothetical protein